MATSQIQPETQVETVGAAQVEEKPLRVPEIMQIQGFKTLFFGQLVSVLGDQLALFAVFNYMAFRLHASPLQVTTTLIAFLAPLAILGPLAGTFVDRWNPKLTMIVSDLFRAVICVALIFCKTIPQMQVALLTLSVFSAFFNPSLSVLVPLLVPAPGRMGANALVAQATQVFRILTPMIAITLIRFMSEKACFIADAVSFLVSAGTLLALSVVMQRREETASRGFISRSVESMRFVYSNSSLSFVLVSITVAMFMLTCMGALMSIYVRDVLHSSSGLFAAFGSLSAIGIILGLQVVQGPLAKQKKEQLVIYGLLALGVATIFLALVRSAWPASVLVMMTGVALALTIIPAQTLFQNLTPVEILGSVSSTAMGLLSIAQIGALALAGKVADAMGIRLLYVGSGIGLLGVCVFGYLRLLKVSETNAVAPESELPLPVKAWELESSRSSERTWLKPLLTAVLLSAAVIAPVLNSNRIPHSDTVADFDSERAFLNIKAITAERHASGTPQEQSVRDYIMGEIRRVGLTPELQDSTVLSKGFHSAPGLYFAGRISNIVTRLPGTEPGKAVMLVGHYDSVASSSGASDDGLAIGTLLETMRALRAGPQLRNDVVFLFTDSEELGNLGAEAFARTNPWAKDVGVVLNFDAAGNSGPALMFETSSANNAWMLRILEGADPDAVASSVFTDLYHLTPNYTDLGVFNDHGMPGMNFANVDGTYFIHSGADDLEHFDRSTLRHMGAQALRLARAFGNSSLHPEISSERLFFQLPNGLLVNMPRGVTAYLAGCLAVAYLGLVVTLFRRKMITFGSYCAGAAFAVISVAGSFIAGLTIWQTVTGVHPEYHSFMHGANPYNGLYYLVGFLLLGLAFSTGVFGWLLRHLGGLSLFTGALLPCVAGLVALNHSVPALAMNLAIPVASALAACGLLAAWGMPLHTATGQHRSAPTLSLPQSLALAGLGAISVYALTACIATMAHIFGIIGFGFCVAAVAALVATSLPALNVILRPTKYALPVALALFGALLIYAGERAAHFDHYHPKQNTIFYALDTTEKRAYWANQEQGIDPWTERFLGDSSTTGPLPEVSFIPNIPFQYAAARIFDLPAPQVRIISDRIEGGTRSLDLEIKSQRGAETAVLYSASPLDLNQITLATPDENVNHFSAGIFQALLFQNLPAEGFRVHLDLPANQKLKLRAADISAGLPLPAGDIPSRTAEMTRSAAIRPYNETTLVTSAFDPDERASDKPAAH